MLAAMADMPAPASEGGVLQPPLALALPLPKPMALVPADAVEGLTLPLSTAAAEEARLLADALRPWPWPGCRPHASAEGPEGGVGGEGKGSCAIASLPQASPEPARHIT